MAVGKWTFLRKWLRTDTGRRVPPTAITPESINNITFAKPPVGKRGYDKDQVDAFLRRAAATLDGRDSLVASDVRAVVFRKPPAGSRGYDEAQVDAFLDSVEAALKLRGHGRRPQ